ncbi:MAG TPA: tetratricopeptide repeat protein [Terriglobia bacterium]|nr:tetratricopeptide repeat protein [Terriglobia bacterium]
MKPTRRFRHPATALLATLYCACCFGKPARAFAGSPGDDPPPDALIKAGHWKRARAAVEPQYQAHPDDAELNYLMSQINDAFGNVDNARAQAEKAVALKSGDARYHRQLADVDGEMAENASLFAKGGWAKKFKAEAEQAAQLDPRNLDARFDLLEYDLQAPRLMGGGKDKAAAMADEIAKINPAQGDLAQARIAEDARDRGAEESWYLRALAASPDDYHVLTRVAGFYQRPPAPRLDQARRYANQAIKAYPSRAEAYSLLASACAAEGRWKELQAALAEASENVPDDLDPYYRAGLAILNHDAPDAGALARAESYFRKYLSADPEGGEPTLAHAHWRLGLVLEKEGRKPEATAELAAAVRLNPDLNAARKDLSRLQ